MAVLIAALLFTGPALGTPLKEAESEPPTEDPFAVEWAEGDLVVYSPGLSGRSIHGALLTADKIEPLWSVELDHSGTALQILRPPLETPYLVVGGSRDGGAVVQIRDLLSGNLECEALFDQPTTAPRTSGWDPRFAAGDVADAHGYEVLFATMVRAHSGDAFEPATYIAMTRDCEIVRSFTSQITPTWHDVIDDLDYHADANGVTRGYALYGGALYPGDQPTIEEIDYALGRTNLIVQDSLSGGMTQFSVADFDGAAGPDFLTGGWWGSMMAAYSYDGTRLWHGDVTGGCGSADRSVLLFDGNGYAGSASYGACNLPALAKFDPTNATVEWTVQPFTTASGMGPLLAADFDKTRPGKELLAYAAGEASCGGTNWGLYLIADQDGTIVKRWCDVLIVRSTTSSVEGALPTSERVYVMGTGSGIGCPTGKACWGYFTSSGTIKVIGIAGDMTGDWAMQAMRATDLAQV